mmetsp:Transcript_4059/g.9522  ORF Transcript_4059/g.9522 Transcript_4059/m.9522 type:complete len:243 (-) Transcript_4059:1704-2432(-)
MCRTGKARLHSGGVACLEHLHSNLRWRSEIPRPQRAQATKAGWHLPHSSTQGDRILRYLLLLSSRSAGLSLDRLGQMVRLLSVMRKRVPHTDKKGGQIRIKWCEALRRSTSRSWAVCARGLPGGRLPVERLGAVVHMQRLLRWGHKSQEPQHCRVSEGWHRMRTKGQGGGGSLWNPALRRRMPRWCLGRVAGVDSLQRQLQRCVPDAKKEHCRPSQLLWQRYGGSARGVRGLRSLGALYGRC